MSTEIRPLPRRSPGETIGVATPLPGKRRQMLAELKRMQQRGEIGTVWVDDAGVVTYQRLREPRAKMPWYAAGIAACLASVMGMLWLLWHARFVLLAAAVLALVLWYLATRPSHRALCPGLHCQGCRG